MAITRTQIAKQLLEQGGRVGLQGGGADFGAPDRAQERADRGYGDPGGGLAATGAPDQGRIADIRQANITLENLRQDKVEEKLEKFRNLGSKTRQFQDYLQKVSPIAKFSTKFGPINTRDFFTDKVLGSKNFSNMTKEQFADLTEEEKETMFGDYMSDRMSGKTDAYGNPIGDRGGDGINQTIPVDTTFAKAPVEEEEDYYGGKNPFDINRVAYRLLADGGAVMDDEPRQAYGLGSIVKKATRAVKKVAKSPIGKAAIIGGLGYLGLTKTGFGTGLMESFSALPPMKQAALIGGGLLTAAPFFMKQEEEEDEEEFERGEKLNIAGIRANPQGFLAPRFMAEGGSTEEKEPVAKKVMPLIDMDGKEKDYRETGGFVDIGRMEKADDVPARLSKNEFVFTADAVRNAGDGSVDKGAEVMYNMMKNLEAGGEVSEESQGLEGARRMFQTSQRLGEVI